MSTNPNLPNDPKKPGQQASEKISPQNTAGSKNQDRTPNGDTSRGVDDGALEMGATGKRGQFSG